MTDAREHQHRGRVTRILAVLLTGAALAAAAAAPAGAQVVFNKAEWKNGSTGFNSKMVCLAPLNCYVYSVLMNRIDTQGPIGNTAATPKVGERFYVHVESSIVFPSSFSDAVKMQVLLPDGLRASIQSNTDVICTITDTSYNFWRDMPECADPVVSGGFVTFGQIEMSNATVGETAHYWFPVVADRPLDGTATMQLTSDMVRNPSAILPDPILSEIKPVVDAAPPAPPAPSGSGGTTGGTTGGGTGGGTTGGTGGAGAPAPAGLKATSAKRVVTIVWKAATGSPTGYEVQVSPNKKSWRAAGKTGAATRKLRWRKGLKGKRYFVRTRALFATGPGAWSTPVRVLVR